MFVWQISSYTNVGTKPDPSSTKYSQIFVPGAVLSSKTEAARGFCPRERLSLGPLEVVAAAELHRHHLHRRLRRFLGSQVRIPPRHP